MGYRAKFSSSEDKQKKIYKKNITPIISGRNRHEYCSKTAD